MQPSGTRQVAGGLLAHAVVRLSVAQTVDMRRAPLQGLGAPFSVSALKHLDEQTLAALAAVRAALTFSSLADASFEEWGVLAAPRYLGRALLPITVARFHAEGAWGVSPHLVPYRSLHSLSGTLSQFLGLHGPNFGVGGGPGCVAELMLAGLTTLASMDIPGLWLVASQIEPEGQASAAGRPAEDSRCEALALALVPEQTPGVLARLEWSPEQPEREGLTLDFDVLASLLESLEAQSDAECLEDDQGASKAVDFSCAGRLTLRQLPMPHAVSRDGS